MRVGCFFIRIQAYDNSELTADAVNCIEPDRVLWTIKGGFREEEIGESCERIAKQIDHISDRRCRRF